MKCSTFWIAQASLNLCSPLYIRGIDSCVRAPQKLAFNEYVILSMDLFLKYGFSISRFHQHVHRKSSVIYRRLINVQLTFSLLYKFSRPSSASVLSSTNIVEIRKTHIYILFYNHSWSLPGVRLHCNGRIMLPLLIIQSPSSTQVLLFRRKRQYSKFQ